MKGNARALSTVTAIIDGTGSVGQSGEGGSGALLTVDHVIMMMMSQLQVATIMNNHSRQLIYQVKGRKSDFDVTGVSLVPGAALGPLLAGVLSGGGWNQVFYMLMAADFLALLVCTSCCCCCCPAPPPGGGEEGSRRLVTCCACLFVFPLQLLLRLVAKELSSSQSHPITAVQ